MKTSLIRFRVADFLKQYPPFDGLPEADLLELAGTGRVSFHEVGEFVFRHGRPRKPSIWVIQQGAVELLDESEGGKRLIDLLGPGDVLGLFDPGGDANYSGSARTRGDVVLYSIDARSFQAHASRHPRIARYLAAYSSLAEGQPEKDETFVHGHARLGREPPSMEYLAARMQAVSGDLSVRELAVMLAGGARAVAVVDDRRRPLGVIASAAVLEHLLGGGDPGAGVAVLVREPPATARPSQGWHAYLRAMLIARTDWVAVTRDGTPGGSLECLLTADDAGLLFGANPVALQQRLLLATSADEWRVLVRRMRSLLADALAGPAVVQQVAEMATLLTDALIEAIVRSARAALAARGVADPGVASCWLTLGQAGRGELLATTQPEIAVVFGDAAARGAEAAGYFRELAAEVATAMQACGLDPSVAAPGRPPVALSLGECTRLLEGIIGDPINNDLYAARTWLDARRLLGDPSIESALAGAVASAMRDSTAFIPILANDTLENMPPMTFFQGLVIGLEGERKDALDLDATALAPIIDGMRVYALAAGELAARNTFERIAVAACAAPKAGPLFRDVAGALRTVSYYRALSALARGGDGAAISPDQLSRYDQRMLKGAFQTIRALVEQIASGFFWRTGQ